MKYNKIRQKALLAAESHIKWQLVKDIVKAYNEEQEERQGKNEE